jgi:2-polyprenyl-6-methoxyphenol hydroxylase-like FAD-dependent oxidoreductase
MGPDVVVVGAGIGGAVLALGLGRRGWRVTLLEREAAPRIIARPEILWGPTLRALEPLGVAGPLRDTAGVLLEAIELGGQAPWLRIGPGDFAAAGVEALSTNPARTRALLVQAALATGHVEVRHGVVVDGLLRDGRVRGVRGRHGATPVEVEARLVVGDDGGASVVRGQLGLALELAAFPVDFVTARIPRWPLPPRRVRAWLRPGGFAAGLPAAVLLPWPADEGALLLPLPAERAQRLLAGPAEDFWAELGRLTPTAGALRGQLEFPRDFRRFARPFGHAATYVADGAALLGDAAHPMTPAGGQGANAAIHDALALAEAADAALSAGDVSRERLLPYERRRWPANERSVGLSRRARGIFRVGRHVPAAAGLPLALRAVGALGWTRRRILAAFASTFVHDPPA